MPFATAAATNAPALVPTYTSNSFTVRLTDSRSSARSAPISYTPPVNPPPPSTSAVFDRAGRRRDLEVRAAAPGRSAPAVSSLTTLPILRAIVRRADPATRPPTQLLARGPVPKNPRRCSDRPDHRRYFDRRRWLYAPMRV